MVTDTEKSKRLWAGKRHIGMVADSAALGVSRFHLWAVLTRRRESKPLLARYRDLKRTQRTAPNSQPTSTNP